MPEPTNGVWRSCERWESISAASDPDSALEPSNGISAIGSLASAGRHCRFLRAGLLVRLLDGPHTAAAAASRPQRRPARIRPARSPPRLRPGHRRGSAHAAEAGKPDGGPPGPVRVLRFGTIPRAHRFVRNLLRWVPPLGVLPGAARRVDEHPGDLGRAVFRPRVDARFPWIVE